MNNDKIKLTKKQIGKNIRHYRNKIDKTIKELANQAKINEKHLGRIERGEKQPSAGTLSDIAVALRITAVELLGGVNNIRQITPFDED